MSNEERLEQLDEFIIDEKNIVTYKWLSRKLDLDIKESKRLLSEYIKDSTRKSKCHVTYVLIAKNVEGDIAVVISKEHDLPTVKNKYENIISQHVYSVQRNMPNDLNILYTVDKQHERGRFGPVIKYPSDNRIKVSKQIEKPIENKEKPKIPVSVSNDNGTKNEANGNINKENELPKGRSNVKEKKKIENAPISSISKLFAKQTAKQDTINKNSDQEPANKKSPKVEKESEEKSFKNIMVHENPNQRKSTKSNTDDPVVKNVNKKSQKKDKKKMPKPKGKKERSKKHKRIVLLSDSSDEGEESDESVKEEVDDEPEREPSPPPSVSEPACVFTYGKKRKRKVIEKTAADDEGFLHISKEVVYETCSSEDEETDNKKQIKLDIEDKKKKENVDQNVVARNNGTMKTKQPSITSFFGKLRSQK